MSLRGLTQPSKFLTRGFIMTETFEIETQETELSDEQLQTISGACALAGTPVGLAGLGLGLHLGLGGFRGFRGGHFGFGGFGFGSFVPVQTIAVVPVQTETVVEQPVTAVQTTTCGVQTLTAGC